MQEMHTKNSVSVWIIIWHPLGDLEAAPDVFLGFFHGFK